MVEINNESLGMSAEKVICDLCGLDASEIAHRSVPSLERRLTPVIRKALLKLPRLVKYVGTERGSRGSQSKSTVDFITEQDETLSVKTTMNSSFKLCPSECGQPGNDTFDSYFGHLYEGKIDYEKFKKVVLSKVEQMLPIYLEHLFDCDYLLLVHINSPDDGYHIFKKKEVRPFQWERSRLSFTRSSTKEWIESNTVKYDGVSIGEFQAHHHRNSYKFRFQILKLAKVMSVALPPR